MKAIIHQSYGSPLRLAERPDPTPGPGEVLVKVHATAINDWDWCYSIGKPYIYRLMFGLRRPKTEILGAEVAGVVEALGEGTQKFQVGDRVYGDLSEVGFGAFAERVCPHEDALERMPDTMSFEQAAAIPHAAMLALQGLVDVGKIQPNERVLINGAGGGVGTIGLQIAKRYGATVAGVDSAQKLDAMRKLGFDRVIDYRSEDFTKTGDRYDLILDTKSNRGPTRYLEALEPKGRYVTVGGALPRLLQLFCMGPALSKATQKQLSVLALKPNQGLKSINEQFTTDGLELLLDGPYPLEEVPRALERFGKAEHIGKVVITL